MKILRPYQQVAVDECWEALKKNDEPVLLMASVGAGKSLMLASILMSMQSHGKRALCLVNNAELVRNNAHTFEMEGGKASVYCAALGRKEVSESIVFGTPQSILNGINKNEEIGKIRFNIIVVDEAHAINYLNNSNCFMRILRHYKQNYPGMRLLGATGTNFRFRGSHIVGEQCLFKTQTGNITTERLINEGYLIKPTFEINPDHILDFSAVKIKKNGQFDAKQLELVIDKSARLTELICRQVIHVMETQKRFGVFLFATTRKHAEEILSHLPVDESAIILGDTPHNERTKILENARKGKIRYLVNIAIISVGVDVPGYDTIAYLRPTESLVLLVQTLGRALRLSPLTGKSEALVMDFAGNIERHRDWDNPVIMEAVKETIDKNEPLIILCPQCLTMNTEHTRRCTGKKNEKRCDYYFEFKECPNPDCRIKNDIAARQCRICQCEIIDPNTKLALTKSKNESIPVTVLNARYSISGNDKFFRIYCEYQCTDTNGIKGVITEHYSPSNHKTANIFYGQFIKKHCESPQAWYRTLHIKKRMHEMLKEAKTPNELHVYHDGKYLKIRKKIFNTTMEQ